MSQEPDFSEMGTIERQFAGFEKNHPEAASMLYFALLFGAVLLFLVIL